MGSRHAIVVATVPRETWTTTSSPWRNSEEPWHQAHPPQQEPSWGSTKESLKGRRREGTGRRHPVPAQDGAHGKGTVVTAQLLANATELQPLSRGFPPSQGSWPPSAVPNTPPGDTDPATTKSSPAPIPARGPPREAEALQHKVPRY